MFKVGDRVVCINDIPFNRMKPLLNIYKYKVYTVNSSDDDFTELFETHNFYNSNRFVLLSKIRKQKLNKLNIL